MLLLNKKIFLYIFSVLLCSLICSCKTSLELIPISNNVPTLPISGVVNAENGSLFRKNNTILCLSDDCILELNKDGYKLKQGTLIESTSSLKRKIKKIDYHTLFPSVTGSFSFFRMLIPKKFNVDDMTFSVKYFDGEKLQDSKKGHVYSYYEDSQINFYGVFLPFSPLYEQERYLLSININFRDGEKVVIYSTGLIGKTVYKEQTLKFPAKKSKDLESASRKKYKIQQAARHELWKITTQPLNREILKTVKPLDNMARMTSDFCFTRKWILNNGKLYSRDVHLGVDYGVPTGTPIYSILDGVVVSSGLQELYGNMIIVDHGLGLYTNYCHMNKRLKKADTLIKKGEALGEVGMTGAATGPHLHIEARIYGIPIDYRKLDCLPELFVVEP